MRFLRRDAIGWLPILLLAVVATSSLMAQRPLSVGIAGGVSVPEGTLRDGVSTGWHVLGTLALGGPMQPLGLRLDAAYNRFALSDPVRTALREDGSQSVSSATMNASYRLPMTGSPLSPYLIAGLGAYRSACSVDVSCSAATQFGWNAGLGTRLYVAGLRSFVEARYHRTSRAGSGIHFLPVTLGLLF